MLGPFNTSVASILLLVCPIEGHYFFNVPLQYYFYLGPNYILNL